MSKQYLPVQRWCCIMPLVHPYSPLFRLFQHAVVETLSAQAYRNADQKGKATNLRRPLNLYAGIIDPVKHMPDRASKLHCACIVQRFVLEHSAETMQAVPNMLELVPKGVNKGSGMRKLLANLELPFEVCLMPRSKLLALLSIQLHSQVLHKFAWSAILRHYWIKLIFVAVDAQHKGGGSY